MAADDRAGAGVPPPSEGEGSELEDIIHDLRIDAADPLARIRHGTYIEDGLILVAEVDRLRARLAAAEPVLALVERVATETYAGATEELLLMAKGRALNRLIAAWEEYDTARVGWGYDAARPAAARPGEEE